MENFMCAIRLIVYNYTGNVNAVAMRVGRMGEVRVVICGEDGEFRHLAFRG